MNKTAIIKECEFTKSNARILADSLFDECEFDKAREEVTRAIAELPSEETDELLACQIMLAKIERGAKNYGQALNILREAYPLAQLTRFHPLKAKLHYGLGITYEEIAAAGQPEYFDRALIEYAETGYHLEEAGKLQDAGYIENNMAVLLTAISRYSEAHRRVGAARRCFEGEPVLLAQVDVTEAQIYLAEGIPGDALGLALDAQKTFLDYREKRLFDESLPTLLKAIADYRMVSK